MTVVNRAIAVAPPAAALTRTWPRSTCRTTTATQLIITMMLLFTTATMMHAHCWPMAAAAASPTTTTSTSEVAAAPVAHDEDNNSNNNNNNNNNALARNPLATTSTTRFAYAMMHYEGTPRDDDYLLGLRVLIHSIQKSGSEQDIVILVSSNTRQSSRQQLTRLGAIVKEIPNIPNPYKDDPSRRIVYTKRFEFTFNKLYLWDMTEYERVIYMDTDNLVVRNADELFMCGHFCAVFMNPVHFHTGLMVVKPNHTRFEELKHALKTAPSYDGADQGFLTHMHERLIYAPLFQFGQRNVHHDAPSEDPLMRLGNEANLNIIYYQLKMSWSAWHKGEYYFSQDDVPALTLAFPVTVPAKPWYYVPHVLFAQFDVYRNVRATLPDDDWSGVYLFRLAALMALTFAVPVLLRSKIVMQVTTGQRRLKNTARRWPTLTGYALGFLIVLSSFVFAVWITPSLMPPFWAVVHFITARCFVATVLFGVFARTFNASVPLAKLYFLKPFFAPLQPAVAPFCLATFVESFIFDFSYLVFINLPIFPHIFFKVLSIVSLAMVRFYVLGRKSATMTVATFPASRHESTE